MSLTLNPMPLNMTSILWTLYAILVFCTNSSIISTLYNLASGKSILWLFLFGDLPPGFISIIISTLFHSTTFRQCLHDGRFIVHEATSRENGQDTDTRESCWETWNLTVITSIQLFELDGCHSDVGWNVYVIVIWNLDWNVHILTEMFSILWLGLEYWKINWRHALYFYLIKLTYNGAMPVSFYVSLIKLV